MPEPGIHSSPSGGSSLVNSKDSHTKVVQAVESSYDQIDQMTRTTSNPEITYKKANLHNILK